MRLYLVTVDLNANLLLMLMFGRYNVPYLSFTFYTNIALLSLNTKLSLLGMSLI